MLRWWILNCAKDPIVTITEGPLHLGECTLRSFAMPVESLRSYSYARYRSPEQDPQLVKVVQ